MTEKLNEFALNFSAAPAAETTTIASTAGEPSDACVIGTPSAAPSKRVSVYANTITPVSYSDDEKIAAFDVVFSVSVFDGETSCAYQVVKRIGIDKAKLAAEAMSSTPVSIVEAAKDPAAHLRALEDDWEKNNGYDGFPSARHQAKALLDAARAAAKEVNSKTKPKDTLKSGVKESQETVSRARRLAGLE